MRVLRITQAGRAQGLSEGTTLEMGFNAVRGRPIPPYITAEMKGNPGGRLGGTLLLSKSGQLLAYLSYDQHDL